MNNDRREAIIWGAGKIGRGFLGEIFTDAGYNLNFVEYDRELVEDLSRAGSYTIFKMLGKDQQERVVIRDFSVYHSQDQQTITELINRENMLMAAAVHPKALPSVIKAMVPGITARAEHNSDSTLDIILCINMAEPAEYCRELLAEYLPEDKQVYLRNNIGLVESVVMRISPEAEPEMLAQDPLAMMNNGYPEMPVDRTAFRSEIPETNMLRPTDQIKAEEKRKIYTLNMAHVMLAYLGTPRQYNFAYEAVADPDIRQAVEGALAETAQGLTGEFAFSEEGMADWNQDVLKTLENPALKDRLSRLGSDSQRKLGREDRLIGPALLAYQYEEIPFYLLQGAAYGLRFIHDDPGTEKVQKVMAEQGLEKTIREICGLTDEYLVDLLKTIYQQTAGGTRVLNKSEFIS